ncbi:MAG: penicillin-binding protein 2 [Phycisphaerales bacterium]|nr:penicillin-binding protein 2 [Phycisphaerales bacterium]
MLRSGIVLFALTGCGLLAGAGKLAYIQYTEGPKLRLAADQQHTATLSIPAQRGDILDARGRVLAGTVRKPSIYVDPSQVDDPRYMAHSVAAILGLNADQVERDIRERPDRGFLWLKRDVSQEEVDQIQEIRSKRQLHALVVQREPHRVYPFGRLASHVVGFVDAEHKGQGGIEQRFEQELQGVAGQRTSTVDVLRRRLKSRAEDYLQPRDGWNVVLTIDVHIQQKVEEFLARAVDKHRADWGTAVVMDCRSGEVLAMATVPDFDPTEPIPDGTGGAGLEAAKERLRNRAIQDSFEPGSIFKPFIMGLALDERTTRLGEIFAINGPTRMFGSRTIRDTHHYDSLAAEEIISKSSNIGMGLIGARAGNDRLHRWVRLYGFGDLTGIQLPGEHTGLVQDYSRWGPFSTQSIPIGQEIAITPIQIATAFCVFANDGVLYRPRIVRGVVSPSGETIADWSEPVAIRRVISEETCRVFRLQALAETVRTGTGKEAALRDYQVFGKTGTAQIAAPGGRGYLPGKYTGSFVGGAPCESPRVVCVVNIYKPSANGYYGGTVAAPVVGQVLGAVLEYLQVPPEKMPEPERPKRAAAVGGDD